MRNSAPSGRKGQQNIQENNRHRRVLKATCLSRYISQVFLAIRIDRSVSGFVSSKLVQSLNTRPTDGMALSDGPRTRSCMLAEALATASNMIAELYSVAVLPSIGVPTMYIVSTSSGMYSSRILTAVHSFLQNETTSLKRNATGFAFGCRMRLHVVLSRIYLHSRSSPKKARCAASL